MTFSVTQFAPWDEAAAGDEVVAIPIPDDVSIPGHGSRWRGFESLAGAFIAYLLSTEGQATLQDYGFEPVA